MLNSVKFLKICGVCTLMISSLYAKTLVNGISVLVNNEPITLYEIHKMSKQMNTPLKDALNTLIEKRLEDSQIKRLGIKANSFEINDEIDKISRENGMSPYELIEFVGSKGMGEKEYRENIANNIKNKKLLKRIFRKNIPAPQEGEIKAYYEAHKELFSQSSAFNVTTYTASTYTALQNIQKSPMSVVSGVELNQQTLLPSTLGKKAKYYLNQTPSGKFTPILKQKDGYVMYLVDKKSDSEPLSYEQARPMVLKYMAKEQERDIVKNYFDKLKADADIEFVRQP